ncbi:hypothetical protein LAZ67_7000176 [Cordylochernes scorpioides]|uniref:Uncharacterized protein n=1 Tax=Cordylochernes scorpioides TaxID=51811 RepID=A0ABY6KRE1_9ARAC|nr:hypothetical protein LAZ67_7000176 [Cordylochernes scorpioides]
MEYNRCSSCIPGLGALTGYYHSGQLSPAAPNLEYKRCSSCIPGLGALTGYYQLGQLNPGPGGNPITAYIFWTTLFSWIPGERDHHRTPRELYQWFPREPDHHQIW